MRGIDLSSWQSVLSTLLTLALVTLVGLGMRLVMISTLQQRRERANRQINERLRTLIAAYKTLGGSFTGDLTVNPAHLRDLRKRTEHPSSPPPFPSLTPNLAPALAHTPAPSVSEVPNDPGIIPAADLSPGSDRSRRMRDAVEAALSDIILLGTEEQVRLAANAAREMVAGRHVHTHELVISLRDFIRKALDLEPIPTALEIPRQGPTRPGGGGGNSGERGKGNKDNASSGGAGGAGGGAMGLGMGMGGVAGAGLGIGHGTGLEDHPAHPDPTNALDPTDDMDNEPGKGV